MNCSTTLKRVPYAGTRGFTYLVVMLLVFLMALAATEAVEIYRASLQRDREEQLIFVGNAYKRALEAYQRASGRSAQPYPKKVEALTEDPRFPDRPRRYLREAYTDPMMPGRPLELIKNASGGIVGVRSHSELAPIRSAGLPAWLDPQAKSYREWKFVAEGSNTMATAPTVPAQSGPNSPFPASPASAPAPDTATDETAPATTPTVAVPQKPLRPADLAPGHRTPEVCAQLLALDESTCGQIARTGEQSLSAQCTQSASVRNGECLGGQSLSSLVIRQ